MPYVSTSQRRFMHAKHPDIAKRWDKEYPHKGNLPEHKKKYKISINNKLKGTFGEMNPDTNEIQINVKKHVKRGKLDRPELASTIAHELMHVHKPKATEKEVYKATAKTKIPPKEQSKLIAKLKHVSNTKVGVMKAKHKLDGKPGDLISQVNESKINNNLNQPSKLSVAIRGMV